MVPEQFGINHLPQWLNGLSDTGVQITITIPPYVPETASLTGTVHDFISATICRTRTEYENFQSGRLKELCLYHSLFFLYLTAKSISTIKSSEEKVKTPD